MNRFIPSALLIALLAASNTVSALSNNDALFLFQQESAEKLREDAERAAAEEAAQKEEEAAQKVIEQVQIDREAERERISNFTGALDDEVTIVKNESLRPVLPAENLDQLKTVVNEYPVITGNVLFNDHGCIKTDCSEVGPSVLSAYLTSSPTTPYGDLRFDSDGTFVFTLNNNYEEVQALKKGDVVIVKFTYTAIELWYGFRRDATLTVRILGNPETADDNVEIENNNRSHLATPLHSGQLIKGHMQSSSDKDWYSIASLGNEILHLEFCPKGSSCFGRKNWVVYVFDELKLTPAIEQITFPLRLHRDDTQQILSTYNSNHMYLALRTGAFGDSVIARLDPCFGDANSLDIGVGDGPRKYLIAVSTPLLGQGNEEEKEEERGCGSGSVVLEKEGPSFEEEVPGKVSIDEDGNESVGEATIKEVTTTQEHILAFPYNDDQYSLIVTGTGVNPLLAKSSKSATYDHGSRIVDLPSVRIGNRVFAAELYNEQQTERSNHETPKLKLLAVDLLDEELTGDPLQVIYNPGNNKVTIPQLIDEQTGVVYSVELLYHVESGNDNWLEVIKITEVK